MCKRRTLDRSLPNCGSPSQKTWVMSVLKPCEACATRIGSGLPSSERRTAQRFIRIGRARSHFGQLVEGFDNTTSQPDEKRIASRLVSHCNEATCRPHVDPGRHEPFDRRRPSHAASVATDVAAKPARPLARPSFRCVRPDRPREPRRSTIVPPACRTLPTGPFQARSHGRRPTAPCARSARPATPWCRAGGSPR